MMYSLIIKTLIVHCLQQIELICHHQSWNKKI